MFSTVRCNSAKPAAAAAAFLAAATTLSLTAILTLLSFGSNKRHLYKSTTTKVQFKSTESTVNTEAIIYYLLYIPSNAPVLYLTLTQLYLVKSLTCPLSLTSYMTSKISDV